LDEFAFENFVAGLHVGEVEIGRHVRQEREELVAEGVPEIQHAVFVRPDKTRAKDSIRLAAENGLQQRAVVLGVVFEIGVLDKHDFRGGQVDASPQSRAFTHVVRVADQLDAGLALGDLENDFRGFVCGAIIHNDDFSD